MKLNMRMMLILKYNMLTAFLISALAVTGADVSRIIKKDFSVTTGTVLTVKNSFGRVNLVNWDKSQFGVEIEIIGKSANDQRAQDIADRIEIDIRESSSQISLETKLNGIRTRNKESFEVNYMIKLPATNPIDISNSFGDVYLDDRNGPVELDVSYGAVKAKDLNEGGDVRISFGKASFDHFSSGRLVVKYSEELEIQSSVRLRMDQEFSNVEITSVGKLDLESKYGRVELGDVEEIDVDIDFSKFRIGELRKRLTMEASYMSDFEIGLLKRDFDDIVIEAKFSSMDIRLDEGLSADIEAYFEFADLKDYVDIDFHYRVKDNNESAYKGKIGAGDPNRKILIRSEYGNCRITN